MGRPGRRAGGPPVPLRCRRRVAGLPGTRSPSPTYLSRVGARSDPSASRSPRPFPFVDARLRSVAPSRLLRALALLAAGLAGAGCEVVEEVEDRFRDQTPHEAYRASLEAAGLTGTALARSWIEAGHRSLEEAVEVTLPFSEAGFITPEDPDAVAYRVRVGRGQRLTARVTLDGDPDTRLFVDLFRVPEDERNPLRPVLSTDSLWTPLVHEPWRGGEYVLRIQPELLRGGRWDVTLRLEAQLAFPVADHDVWAIQSRFGAPREGGRRSHHGVDIFAPRGTPVVATSDGTVRRVEVTRLGGKVVWLRDAARNASIYYAHLDSQAVADGDRVTTGDTLGFVGNTGNARTTPPHLHFGIYRRGEGPVDPEPFIESPPGALPPRTADLGRLGSWVRMENPGIRLRSGPSRLATVIDELEEHAPLRVLGAAGDWYRVRLPNGRGGFVAARLTEPVDAPVGTRVASASEAVQAAPRAGAPVVAELRPGSEVGVLGRFGGYLYVQAPTGEVGWLGAATSQP